MSSNRPDEISINPGVTISQSVAILVDGNNIERSIQDETGDPHTLVNFDTLVPKLLGNRGLNRLVYFREGKNISSKLSERLYQHYHGSVRPCHKSADIPLTIKAMQLSSKVDTIIILSGDSDYVELVRHLKTEGVRVEIAAIPSSTSHVLREEADYYHEISREDWYKVPQKRGMPHPRHQQHRTRSQRSPSPPSSTPAGREEG